MRPFLISILTLLTCAAYTQSLILESGHRTKQIKPGTWLYISSSEQLNSHDEGCSCPRRIVRLVSTSRDTLTIDLVSLSYREKDATGNIIKRTDFYQTGKPLPRVGVALVDIDQIQIHGRATRFQKYSPWEKIGGIVAMLGCGMLLSSAVADNTDQVAVFGGVTLFSGIILASVSKPGKLFLNEEQAIGESKRLWKVRGQVQ